MMRVTRRYGFPAAHVLSHPSFSAEENDRIYGRCANPNGHGHNYGVEVSVEGPIDPVEGRIVDPDLLDSLFEECIGSRLGHSMLNEHAWFRDLVPTAENIASVIHRELEATVAGRTTARVTAVRIVETRKNSFVHGEV